MTRRAVHISLALSLALGVFIGTTLSASAQEPSEVYFPWVPNGAEIEDDRDNFGDNGPFYGTVTIQNLEDEEIEIDHETTATGETGSDTIDAHGSLTLAAEHLFLPGDDVDGSGVLVTAAYPEESTTEGMPRIAGVQKQMAPANDDDDAVTDEDHDTVGGYTGLTGEEIVNDVVLPIAQTNSNWNTLIRVTNFENDDSDITLTLQPAGGGSTLTHTVEDVGGLETFTVDLLSLGLSAEWIGSVTIDATDGDVNLGAVAERVKNETNMLVMNTSRPMGEDNEQFAPLVFNNFNFWNTGIAIADLSGSENNVTITYYDVDGNEVGDPDEVTLPANGMDFVYTPALPDDEGDEFIGSAVVEADGAITGAVDEVKYFGDDPNTGHAMSYMLEEMAAGPDDSLVMPLVQKGNVDAEDVVHGDTSGIHLFNPSDDWVVVGITYLDQDGNIELIDVQFLDAQEGHTSYTIDLVDLDEDFQGSAIVQNLSGDGSVVGASNNVNYDVEFDGSASFNLVQTGDLGEFVPADDIEDAEPDE